MTNYERDILGWGLIPELHRFIYLLDMWAPNMCKVLSQFQRGRCWWMTEGLCIQRFYRLMREIRFPSINNDNRDRATNCKRGAIKVLWMCRGAGYSLQVKGSEDTSWRRKIFGWNLKDGNVWMSKGVCHCVRKQFCAEMQRLNQGTRALARMGHGWGSWD